MPCGGKDCPSCKGKKPQREPDSNPYLAAFLGEISEGTNFKLPKASRRSWCYNTTGLKHPLQQTIPDVNGWSVKAQGRPVKGGPQPEQLCTSEERVGEVNRDKYAQGRNPHTQR